MCPPTHLKNRDRYSLRSHRITYFISLTARVYSYVHHRMIDKTRGHLHTSVHSRCYSSQSMTSPHTIDSIYTQLAYTISPPNEVCVLLRSIAVTRFVISSFTYHLTRYSCYLLHTSIRNKFSLAEKILDP
jgi:hypothetical protein